MSSGSGGHPRRSCTDSEKLRFLSSRAKDTVWKKPAGLRDHCVAIALSTVPAEANITPKVAGAAKREPKRTAAAATE